MYRTGPFAVLLLAGIANAGGLENLGQVDLVTLEPQTSRVQLLVVLEEDRVNMRQALKALYKKFNNYQDFITSGQVAAAAPTGNIALRPVVVVVAPKDASSGEIQNIEGLKLAASKIGAAVEIRPYIPGLRPISIKPGLAKNGA